MWQWLQQLFQALSDWINRCIPAYDPRAWNDSNGIQFNNNCYNYACNIQTNTVRAAGPCVGAHV
jgi:hypothetical protein